jgi:pyruvate dehydrogenase E2 component (dihydrolipoamide acetyltransferase)
VAKEQVTVPDIGGAEGAEVIELLVAVGDEIALDQSLIVL